MDITLQEDIPGDSGLSAEAFSSLASSTDAKASASRPVPKRPAADDDLIVPKNWIGEAPDVGFVVASMPTQTKTAFSSRMNLFYGTTVSMVVASFLKALFKARVAQNPANLLIDMVFSVFLCQTISREWAAMYNTLGDASMFKQYEITGPRSAADKNSNWVTSSRMNSTAIHALGHCIMASSNGNTSLGKKAQTNGTIFNVVTNASDYSKICSEMSKSVTAADKEALTIFATHGATLIKAVEVIMESGAGDLDAIVAKVSSLAIKKF